MEPDTKDWTWVLERPCPDCGFDAAACPTAAVPDVVRATARSWQRLLADGAIRPGRPDPATWSSLEYACHVRDVFRRFDVRIGLMLDEDDPAFANWDQDATAVDDAYDEQDAATVVAELVAAADAVAARIAGVPDDAWDRSGRRSDGARFTVASISRYMAHDPVHHLWDLTGATA